MTFDKVRKLLTKWTSTPSHLGEGRTKDRMERIDGEATCSEGGPVFSTCPSQTDGETGKARSIRFSLYVHLNLYEARPRGRNPPLSSKFNAPEMGVIRAKPHSFGVPFPPCYAYTMRAKGDLVGESKEGVDVMILSFGYRATAPRVLRVSPSSLSFGP